MSLSHLGCCAHHAGQALLQLSDRPCEQRVRLQGEIGSSLQPLCLVGWSLNGADLQLRLIDDVDLESLYDLCEPLKLRGTTLLKRYRSRTSAPTAAPGL